MRILIKDELPPEAMAMLQALYSRSASSVDEHILRVAERGSADFMKSYYVGYGHESIGDCGSTTLFVEGISILACKAIQDNPLYSGQETSTRYIDFSGQGVVDPIRTEQSRLIHNGWMGLYRDVFKRSFDVLTMSLKREEGISEAAWSKALKARSFDVARAFLPAGIKTQLSWSTNLRQANDNVLRLRSHPLPEVRQIGDLCRESLRAKYPSSFNHKDRPKRDAYLREHAIDFAYWADERRPVGATQFQAKSVSFNGSPQAVTPGLAARPKGTQLPRSVGEALRFQFKFLLDYGSYRDLQRHRNAFCPIPLLDLKYGLNSWYMEQIPDDLTSDVLAKVAELEDRIYDLCEGCEPTIAQYFIPIGYSVDCVFECSLNQAIYVAELRSAATVHPTLRLIAQSIAQEIEKTVPGLALYADMSPDRFNYKRGYQDIVSVK